MNEWILGVTVHQILSCFPDLDALDRKFQESEKAAVKAQEEHRNEPSYVLGNAYVRYVNVKRCYEARQD
jgi:hypothetical protein